MKKLVLAGLILSSMHTQASWLGDMHQEFGMDSEDFAYIDTKEDVVQASDRADEKKVSSPVAEKSFHSVMDHALQVHRDDIGIDADDFKEYEDARDERQQYAEQHRVDQGSSQGLASWIASKLSNWNGKSLQQAVEYEQQEHGIDQQDIADLEKAYEVTIDGKLWSQLTTDEERALYMQQRLAHDQVADDVNYPLVGVLASHFSDEQVENFIKNIRDNAKKNNKNVVTLENIELAVVNLTRSEPIKEFYANAGLADRITADINLLYQKGYNWLFPSYKKQGAYHEAAHALIYTLKDHGYNVLGLSIKPNLGKEGGVASIERVGLKQILFEDSASLQNTSSHIEGSVNANLKNYIMGCFAGDIGEQIYTGKKLSFDDFLLTVNSTSSSSSTEGIDLRSVYELSRQYIISKDFDIVFDEDLDKIKYYYLSSYSDEEVRDRIDKQVHTFLEECYEQTFDILEKHKATLDALVQEALKDDVLAGSKIYEIVGKERPKYDKELTGGEKMFKTLAEWLSWTVKRMNVYQTHESGEHA